MLDAVENLKRILANQGVRCGDGISEFGGFGRNLDLLDSPVSICIYKNALSLSVATYHAGPVIKDIKTWFSPELDDPAFQADFIGKVKSLLPYYIKGQQVIIGGVRKFVSYVEMGQLHLTDGDSVSIRSGSSVPLRVS